MNIQQTPATFSKTVLYSGDTLLITLELDRILPGKAFVRTNLGNNSIRLREIIEQIELAKAPLGCDWHDISMRQTDSKHFSVTLPINEVGFFEFKAFFVEDGTNITFWPRGENASVKIEAPMTFADNTIYNAFIRQFGENKEGKPHSQQHHEAEMLLNSESFSVIPPSGTFRDFAAKLDFIIGELGFRIIQLLPIHPVPTTFGRMGRFGSPFAPLDFFTVDPALASFDRKVTPLEQFVELVDEIHVRDGLIMLDLPVGHTGWGSVLQVHHPEWFVRNPDGSFASPGAWGVVWEDLCKMDYSNQQLWRQMAEVFLHWCRLGVDGFRCDAGYMIPADAWNYLIAKVRDEYPETIFFLEGLGGKIETTERLLCKSNLNWAYSEIFQQYNADELKRYLDFVCRFSQQNGVMVHFAETHDNSRLAAHSKAWAALRTTLAALLAPAGSFGIANGVEWLSSEKIDVHEASSLNWDSADNLIDLIRRLNTILKTHPAFQADSILHRPVSSSGSAVALLRTPTDREQTVLVIINPNDQQSAHIEWDSAEFAAPANLAWDLLHEENIRLTDNGGRYRLELAPAACCCLAKTRIEADKGSCPTANQWQTMKDIVLDTFTFHRGVTDCHKLKMNHLLEILHDNPIAFLREMYGPKVYLPVLFWQPYRDETRVVPLPPEHHLLVRNATPFVVKISLNKRCLQKHRSIPLADGSHFALFQPLPVNGQTQMAELEINLFADRKAIRHSGQIALLPKHPVPVELRLSAAELRPEHCALASSELGAYAMPRAIWGNIQSQYDALLAANLDAAVPIDRTIMLTRCRAWLVHRDYSRELNLSCQDDFAVLDSQSMRWNFTIPSGMGENIRLNATLQFCRSGNALQLAFTREKKSSATDQVNWLSGSEPICLILRPDIDDRSCHSNTKAFHGAETRFPNATRKFPDAFEFSPSGQHRLRMSCSTGCYFSAPEWKYQIPHPIEAERGLEPSSDLFSPGFFRVELRGGDTATFDVSVAAAGEKTKEWQPAPPPETAKPRKLPDILRESMQSFVVKRENSYSVIAGYPWFLDWGRDTLIVLRGLIAAGMLQESQQIICQFASFEQGGTLPNTLAGHQVGNRDTSDAPLWLFIAARDYAESAGTFDLLQTDCQGRTLLQVLESIAENYLLGTANGISVCPETALVFSPAHFTWMDTNYPAATPREGYPVEIQALWIAALEFLGKISSNKKWIALAGTARKNLQELFYAGESIGFSDCLHASAGCSALLAKADDLCRPNQLLAITLGALDMHKIQRHILRATQPLLVPGGMRSLADRKVSTAQPVYQQGNLLNDPLAPYWGNYLGDEDTRRKPAYHNGTAWGWLLPTYCEALFLTFGKSARPAVHALHNLAAGTLLRGCLGHLPEILDGNAPHLLRGCPAQAWSISELYRVLGLLQNEANSPKTKGG